MPPNISAHERWLEEYAAAKIAQAGGAEPLRLKLEHSFKVYAAACAIIGREKPENPRACRLAALYHDVGRFDQFLRFGTFKDALSCDHGFAGVRILKREKRLAGEDSQTARLALAAIALHNKKSVSEKLAAPCQAPCHITRDADKLDILRVIAEHLARPGPYNPTIILSLPDDPGLCGEKVLEGVERERPASYADLKSVNDFRVLLGSWFYDLRFAASRDLFISDGYGQRLVEGLPDNSPYARAKAKLLGDFARHGRR